MPNLIKSVPDLRFPEFQDEWAEGKLDTIITEYRAKSDENNKYIVLTSSNKGLMRQSEYYGENRITEKDNAGFNIIPSGYITYRSRSDNRKFTFNINDLGITGVISTYYPVFSIKNGSNKFFVEYFNYRQHYLGRHSVGTSQQVLSLNELRTIRLRFPVEGEQQKIGAFLSAMDQKIAQLDRKRALLARYKTGVMQRIFHTEIRFKDTNGNNFPDWEEKRLDEVATINPRSGPLPGEFIYIDLESVENGLLKREERLRLEDAPSRAQRVVKKSDILFQIVRPYQKNNLFFDKNGDYVASTGYAQIRPEINAKFLYQTLSTYEFVKAVVRRCTGTSYPAINSDDLSQIKIRVPVPVEQEKIAAYLTAIDEKIYIVGRQLERTKQFKKGLLQQMFV